jgi:HPt (histidine-containing phosphotransfer) domain-containing protein
VSNFESQTGFGAFDDDPLAGDPDLRKELAEMFLTDGPGQLAQVREALTRQDGPALQAAAHTLKGSVGIFQDQAAYEAALRLEHIGRDADWPPAEDAWQVLDREVARLLRDVEAMAATDGSIRRRDGDDVRRQK